MSIMDSIPWTGMTCSLCAPDGQWCKFKTDDKAAMGQHLSDHYRPENYGYWWDNCPVFRNPIRLTADMVLRAHGRRGGVRCAGSGNVGTFQLRCRG